MAKMIGKSLWIVVFVAAIGVAVFVALNVESKPKMVEYLFVQHSEQVSLEDGVLTLDGIGESVLFFSDRPQRIAGRESLANFLDAWHRGEDSFEVNPPNAVLTIVRDGEPRDLVVVLRDPVLTGDTLAYTVDVLKGPQAGTGDYASLFIDAFGLELGKKHKGKGRSGDARRSRGREVGIPGGEPGIPGAEVGRLGVDAGKPGVEAGHLGKPGAEVGRVGVDAGIPGAEPGIPGAELGIPGAEPGIPGAELGIPGAEPGIPELERENLGDKVKGTGKHLLKVERHATDSAREFLDDIF